MTVGRGAVLRTIALFTALLFLLTTPVSAAPTQGGPFDVFYNGSISKGKAGLFFVNVRTGLSNDSVTNGAHHALLGSGVIFDEIGSGAVKIAYPDGRIEPFAPLQRAAGQDSTQSINWITSSNGKWIAWAISQTQDQSVLSDLYLAPADGGGAKLVLHTSSTKSIATIPLAVDDTGTTIFYSREGPDTLPYQLFPTASDVFSLDVASGKSSELPGKTDCTCAIGFSSDGRRFARLEAGAKQSGFAIHLWDLSIGVNTRIDPPQIPHRQAGYILISHDGSAIVYTSARGIPPAKGVPAEAYAVIDVDVPQQQQRLVAGPVKAALRPVAFSPDNGAVILVGTDSDGTYKLRLKDGNMRQVSAYTFIGTIR